MIDTGREYPKQVILKDGQEVVLRLLRASDRAGLKEFYERIPEEERWYLRYHFGLDAVIDEWFGEIEIDKRLVVVAELKERLVGVVTVARRLTGAFSHRGRIWIAVDPDYRGRRLGTWMLLDIINQAVSLGLERLEVRFVVGPEDQAIDGARRLDFFEAARLPRYAKTADGQYLDLKIMIKRLHPGWDDF